MLRETLLCVNSYPKTTSSARLAFTPLNERKTGGVKMEEKKAIVFDTNFIFSRKDLKNDIEKLKDDFIVYVTQVSIEERIAQECRTIKKDYESVESYKVKYKKYAKIEFLITY